MISVVLGLLRGVHWGVWVVAAAVLWGGLQSWRAERNTKAAAAAEQRAALEAATAKAESQARQLEQTYTANVRSAADAYAQNMRSARAAADRTRTDLDGLRVAVAAIPACPAASDPAATGRVDGAAGLRVVVGQCAAAVQEVAAAADACDARVTGLQDYIRAIQPPKAQP